MVYVLDVSSDHVKQYSTISATLSKGYGFLKNASTIVIIEKGMYTIVCYCLLH